MPVFAEAAAHAPAARAEIARKMRLAAELERKAGEELDRLVSVAIEISMPIVDIAKLSGIGAPAIAARKSKPIFCEVCESPMGYRGRGRPPKRCEACR